MDAWLGAFATATLDVMGDAVSDADCTQLMCAGLRDEGFNIDGSVAVTEGRRLQDISSKSGKSFRKISSDGSAFPSGSDGFSSSSSSS